MSRSMRRRILDAQRTGSALHLDPHELRDFRREVKRLGLRHGPVEQLDRIPDDCFRMAAAIAYGWDYNKLPALAATAETQATWEAWARSRGMRLCTSDTLAPIYLERWIARVVNANGVGHALAMTHDQVLADPAGPNGWQRITAGDVTMAFAFALPGFTFDEDRSWRISAT